MFVTSVSRFKENRFGRGDSVALNGELDVQAKSKADAMPIFWLAMTSLFPLQPVDDGKARQIQGEGKAEEDV